MKEQYNPDKLMCLHGEKLTILSTTPPPLPTKKRKKKKKIVEFVKKDKKGYVSKVDVEYLKMRRKNHNDLPYLTE